MAQRLFAGTRFDNVLAKRRKDGFDGHQFVCAIIDEQDVSLDLRRLFDGAIPTCWLGCALERQFRGDDFRSAHGVSISDATIGGGLNAVAQLRRACKCNRRRRRPDISPDRPSWLWRSPPQWAAP